MNNERLQRDKAFLEDLAKSLLKDDFTLYSKNDVEEFNNYLKSINKSKADDETLESYFKKGCVPTENNFSDLIKSKISKGDAYLKGETYSKKEIDDNILSLVVKELELLKKDYLDELDMHISNKVKEIEESVNLLIAEDYGNIKDEVYKDAIVLFETEIEKIAVNLQQLVDENFIEISLTEIDSIINRLK